MIAQDKIKHFAVGALIGIISYLFLYKILGIDGGLNIILSVWMSTIGGVLKEIYDREIKKTIFDVYDILFTISGGLFGAVLSFLL